ncbi:MAG: hypothetical protein HC846_11005 [Blastocatellia bacterium]|nr:hypothetical protein [Blastocatellia bacterium]
MSNNIVISVNGLGKKYRIGEKPKSYKTLRDSIVEGISHFGKTANSENNGSQQKNFGLYRIFPLK